MLKNIKAKKYISVIGVIIMASLAVGLAVLSYQARQRSLSPKAPERKPDAANPSCYMELVLSTPPLTTITPRPSVTPGPSTTPRPSITPTPTPGGTACINWANNERSANNASDVVKINDTLSSVTLVKTHSGSTTGFYNLESMDSHPVTKVLYAFPTNKRGIYIMDSSGNLSFVANLSPQLPLSAVSFRNSDNSLWGWVKGKGLYKINISTGAMTQVLASTLDSIEGLAWDNSSTFLYLSRTPVNLPKNATYELRRYDPTNNSVIFYAALPRDTDALDFAPSGYLGGHLVGVYATSGRANFYTYNVATKSVVQSYSVLTSYNNLDALAICVNK